MSNRACQAVNVSYLNNSSQWIALRLPTTPQIGGELKKRPFTQGERSFVLQLAQGCLSTLEQALVHPSIGGQDDSRLTLYISLSLFRKILVIGTHAFRFGPVICTFYLVAVVHLRQLYAHHVAGFSEVAHFHNGVLAGAESILSSHRVGTIGDEELLAGVSDLVLGGRLHLVAKHGFDFGVSFRQQPGIDQRVGALFALTAAFRASRLVRNVLAVAGHPVLRMRAFQVPEEVLTIVAMSTPVWG